MLGNKHFYIIFCDFIIYCSGDFMKVCFCGGGTLGHVIPALSIIDKIDADVLFIASTNGVEKEIIKNNSKIKRALFIEMRGLNRDKLCLNMDNLDMMKKYKKSKTIIEEFFINEKPDVVIGMGGYISYVSIKVALKMKIKTIIHEQNAIMGLSNKLVYHKVNLVLLSFPIEKLNHCNVKVIGNPRVTEVNLKYSDINIEKPRTLLVVGGSRGAEKINELIIDNKEFFVENKIKCTLITGKKYFINNQQKIKDNNCEHLNIISFVEDLLYYILFNQVIISRSGATTISEITALNKPCIFIPSPNVTNNHQYKNIINIYQSGLCEMIEEKNINNDMLQKMIKKMFDDGDYRMEMVNKLKGSNSENIIDNFISSIKEVINS